jgi:hypothetical protein
MQHHLPLLLHESQAQQLARVALQYAQRAVECGVSWL